MLTAVIPVLVRLRQEDCHGIKDRLDYMKSSYLKDKEKEEEEKRKKGWIDG